MIDYRQIKASNPWWEAKENIEKDDEVVKWERSMRYDPHLRHKITYDFEPDNTVVYTLKGPRQVGKTTMIKLQIRDFLRDGIWPWNIFYYSFDLMDSKSDLVAVIESYLRLRKKYGNTDRSYIFLDEVSSIIDWQKGIKWLIDTGQLENCTILATGSRAVDISKSVERLPGRRGRATDVYDHLLTPMKFSEFVGTQDKEIKQFMKDQQLLSSNNRKDILLQLSSKEIPKEIDMLHNNFINDLNNYLYEYMLIGGTPKIVDGKTKTNFIPPEIYASYLDGIKGDWGQLRNVMLLKQFIGAIINSLGSSTSWNNLRKLADLNKWDTAQNYALLLKDFPIINIIHRYNEKRKSPLFTKEKKIYFQDPFYLHMFNSWFSTNNPFEISEKFLSEKINQGKMAESIVSTHLIMLAFSLAQNKLAFDYFDNVFFWKDRKGREVDFVLYTENDFEMPIEVKYRNRVDNRELGGLTSFLDETNVKSGLVLSKNELDEKYDYLFLPTSVFLMLI